MASRPRPKAADYAAIGVGPVLIFLMISSLANFFVSLFYEGAFSDRVFYLILMYTMGAVALARIVIEENRAYSAGYAIALGLAMTFVASGFLGSPIFALGLVLLIGYLADRIVHDCTVIDEGVDASGEGLIDRGLDEMVGLSKQRGEAQGDDEAPVSERVKRRKKSHQPGRTVFLLALAALPLFGLGQFVLRSDPQTWARAQLMLGLYLFSSLSLLVTTSFLNLRRYLRQRHVDMPADVTVAWLVGGVALIAALLLLAFLAPMPGSAIARIELPNFLKSDEMTASSWGWGDEAADQSNQDSDAETAGDPNPGDKDQKGAGDNNNRPSGQPQGQQQSGQQQSGQQQSGQQQSGQQQSGQQQSGQQQSGQQQSGQQQSGQQQSGQQQSGQQQSGQQQSGQQQSGQQQTSESRSSDQNPTRQDSRESQPTNRDDRQPDPQQSDQQQSAGDQASTANESPADSSDPSSDTSESSESSQSSSSSSLPSLPQILPAISGLIRLLLILALVGIVAFYLYQMREQLARWWNSLFGGPKETTTVDPTGIADLQAAPPRPFASFRNPLGVEKDPRRIVVITAQAFDAWARERGFARRQDETPSEFVQRLKATSRQRQDARALFAPIDTASDRLTMAYDRIVFGRGVAQQKDIEAAQQIWQHMTQSRVPEPAAVG